MANNIRTQLLVATLWIFLNFEHVQNNAEKEKDEDVLEFWDPYILKKALTGKRNTIQPAINIDPRNAPKEDFHMHARNQTKRRKRIFVPRGVNVEPNYYRGITRFTRQHVMYKEPDLDESVLHKEKSKLNTNHQKYSKPKLVREEMIYGHNEFFGLKKDTPKRGFYFRGQDNPKGRNRITEAKGDNLVAKRYRGVTRFSIQHGSYKEPDLDISAKEAKKPTFKRHHKKHVKLKLDKDEMAYKHNKLVGDYKELSIRTNDSLTDSEVRSTKLCPEHLMEQQEKEEEELKKTTIKVKKEHSNNVDDDFVLSEYEVVGQINSILSHFKNVKADVQVLGRTESYNDIYLFKITHRETYFRAHEKYAEEKPQKNIIFIVHALSSMGLNNVRSLTVERYLRKLLKYYTKHLDKFDIFLIPLANPDGYDHTRRLSYTFWNKNASPQSECPGVALDRNFDVAWNKRVNISSCSQVFPGRAPFSEPESRAVRDVLHDYGHKIVAYFNVHSGTYNTDTFKGDAVLYPKGYTDVQSDDDKYLDIKGEIDEAMRNASFKTISVTVDTLYNWYGKISGSSVDYASSIYGIPYAMELVMQIYSDPFMAEVERIIYDSESDVQLYALTEIWRRILDVLFTNIWRKTNNEED